MAEALRASRMRSGELDLSGNEATQIQSSVNNRCHRWNDTLISDVARRSSETAGTWASAHLKAGSLP